MRFRLSAYGGFTMRRLNTKRFRSMAEMKIGRLTFRSSCRMRICRGSKVGRLGFATCRSIRCQMDRGCISRRTPKHKNPAGLPWRGVGDGVGLGVAFCWWNSWRPILNALSI